MAEVHVTSWSEFLQAIQASGDTVHCPDGAVWDMNNIEPDGHIGTIRFDCDAVYGHNTTIKNLKYDGNIPFHSGFSLMTDLHWENILANTQENSKFFDREGTISSINDLSQMTLCKFSGFFTKTNTSEVASMVPIYGFKCYRCGINLEYPGYSLSLPAKLEYTNILAQLPNVQYLYGYNGTKPKSDFGAFFSNIVMVAPNCTVDWTSAYAVASVFRGRKERLTQFNGTVGGAYMSLYCTTDMQSMSNPRGVVGVTEEQLRDANYLQSIGFPIAVD